MQNTEPCDDELLTVDEAAGWLKMSARTLKDWRVKGKGPRFMRVGTMVRYRRKDVREWVEQHLETVG